MTPELKCNFDLIADWLSDWKYTYIDTFNVAACIPVRFCDNEIYFNLGFLRWLTQQDLSSIVDDNGHKITNIKEVLLDVYKSKNQILRII